MSIFGCLKVEECKYIQNVNILPLVFRKKQPATQLKNMDLVDVKVLFERAVTHLWQNVLCGSVLLWLCSFRFAIWEVLIFNTKFIYIHDFDLAEWHISILKSQQKHDISVVIHSWIIIEMWFHYCSLYGTACPCLPGRNMPIKASSNLLLFSKFTVLVTCFLCFYLIEVHIQLFAAPAFSLPHMTWHSCYQERLFAQPTAAAEGLKQMSPSSQTCVKISALYDS